MPLKISPVISLCSTCTAPSIQRLKVERKEETVHDASSKLPFMSELLFTIERFQKDSLYVVDRKKL